VFVAYLLNGTAFYVELAVALVSVLLLSSSIFEYFSEKKKREKDSWEFGQTFALL
jgi:hypothetical protein